MIDKTIEVFENMKRGVYPWRPEKYFDTAIETMRKYQRIQEIVNDRYGKPTFKFMDAIIKVVENGSN